MPHKRTFEERRTLNKAARHVRRDEITNRWHRRVILRMLEGEVFPNTHNLRWLLDHGHLATFVEMTSAMRGEDARQMLALALRVIELKEMPYKEYLRQDEWRTMAERVKKLAQYRCSLNENHKAEHAHHRSYARRGLESQSDLIALCAECHAKHHGWD